MVRAQYSETQLKILSDRGIEESQADEFGILPIHADSDGYEWFPEHWKVEHGYLPGLLFPWVSMVSGEVTYQLRPDVPPTYKGDTRKYVFKKGAKIPLNALRWDETRSRTLIVEGTCQSIAAAIYSPPDLNVLGIAGCRNWQRSGLPIDDIFRLARHEVFILLDSDMARNPEVYEAGQNLAEQLDLAGASVRFAEVPGEGKQGLDDQLAIRPKDIRTDFLERLLDKKRTRTPNRVKKPSPAIIKARNIAKAKEADRERELKERRPRIDISGERLHVVKDIEDAMLKRHGGRTMFSRGGKLVRLQGESLSIMSHGAVGEAVLSSTRTGKPATNVTPGGSAWVDLDPTYLTLQILGERYRFWPELEQIVTSALVRTDGSIRTEPGYDEFSKTYVALDESTRVNLKLPDQPSREDVRSAVKLLAEEWLGDFPFPEPSDLANAMALLLTPMLRGWFDTAPLCIVDGNGIGSGKGLFADLASRVILGHPAGLINYVSDGDEMRKAITAQMVSGAPLIVWDEAHSVSGTALAQLMTAPEWRDRRLGHSEMIAIPNRATYMSLGNNVEVNGDMSRRVYRIRLHPYGDHPERRKASEFRHPNIKEWTEQHRGELLAALLTLIRSWDQAGRPMGSDDFGSFDRWQSIVGGIIENAGVPSFLEGREDWVGEVDIESDTWAAHLKWLFEKFGETPFKSSDAAAALTQEWISAPQPTLGNRTKNPALTPEFVKHIGHVYRRHKGRPSYGLTLHYAGRDGNSASWVIDPSIATGVVLSLPQNPQNPQDSDETVTADQDQTDYSQDVSNVGVSKDHLDETTGGRLDITFSNFGHMGDEKGEGDNKEVDHIQRVTSVQDLWDCRDCEGSEISSIGENFSTVSRVSKEVVSTDWRKSFLSLYRRGDRAPRTPRIPSTVTDRYTRGYNDWSEYSTESENWSQVEGLLHGGLANFDLVKRHFRRSDGVWGLWQNPKDLEQSSLSVCPDCGVSEILIDGLWYCCPDCYPDTAKRGTPDWAK